MRVDSSLQGTNAKTFEGSCRRFPLPGGGFPPITAVGATAGKSYSTTTGLVTVPCMVISRHSQYWQLPVGPLHTRQHERPPPAIAPSVGPDIATSPLTNQPLFTDQVIAECRGHLHADLGRVPRQ